MVPTGDLTGVAERRELHLQTRSAREIGDANGWRRLMSNSAKIVNILGGYGYEPVLAPMERCVESACSGRIMR